MRFQGTVVVLVALKLDDLSIRRGWHFSIGGGRMRSTRSIPFLALLLSLLAGTVNAQQHDWWHSLKTDWHRMNCWPKPFVYADRNATVAPFVVMINNGWRRQTTLGSHHFDAETQELNHAGKEQLRWILTQTPLSRRVAYVQRGANVDSTATRVDSVQQGVTQVIPRGPMPEVVQVDRPPAGLPADLIDTIYRKAQQPIPDPVLPATGGGGGGGGSQ